MKSAYPGKMCIYFLELPFLKCNENAAFLFKDTHNKEKGTFFVWKVIFFLMFDDTIYFLNKALHKPYSKYLRSYNSENWKKYIKLFPSLP